MQFSGKDFDVKLEENSKKFRFSDPETSVLHNFEKSHVVVVVVFCSGKTPTLYQCLFKELLCRKVS